MTHSLEALKSGKLLGTKTLKLACGLKKFPEEILSLSDSLEVLDLSDNKLTDLPDSFAQLKNLKILFFARNDFTVFPKILKSFTTLRMIGFKSNHIQHVPENAFPTSLSWLILTDNKIQQLPKSIGDCPLLRKCALAGNQIEELPYEMSNCVNLELLRVSANKLKSIPEWLFKLPKLSWIAFSGNPAAAKIKINTEFESFSWKDFSIKELLGEGASGFISKAKWNSQNKDIAIKIFKGNVTSDGLPDDEMGIAIATGFHESLIPILGKIKDHPDGKSGLIMKLIPPTYNNLGNPPSLETCTRDTFDNNSIYSFNEFIKIAKSIASVCTQLHSKGINHGDLYAHNILVNNTANCILGDFGAASFYNTNSEYSYNIERIEVRAYGCLLEDILGLVDNKEISNHIYKKAQKLIADCLFTDVKLRPDFSEIVKQLSEFNTYLK